MASNDPASEFDTYSRSYDTAVNASIAFSGLKVDFFTKVKASHIKRIIRERFGSERDVNMLDVGCGVGNYHPYFAQDVASLSGVDVSAACIQTASERNANVSYKVYDGKRLPYDDASFDVVYTICVMHHVPPSQWQAFASELRRVVRPGGLALVFEHNPFNPLTRRAVSTCEFDKDAVLLQARTTARLLRNAGFGSIDSRYILTVPPINSFLDSIDRLFSRIPLGGQYYVSAS
jgi:2-polyprenyl-3-methyl-5-hydroxy-6-metoxy-1,4-benzoquinol methylase